MKNTCKFLLTLNLYSFFLNHVVFQCTKHIEGNSAAGKPWSIQKILKLSNFSESRLVFLQVTVVYKFFLTIRTYCCRNFQHILQTPMTQQNHMVTDVFEELGEIRHWEIICNCTGENQANIGNSWSVSHLGCQRLDLVWFEALLQITTSLSSRQVLWNKASDRCFVVRLI